MLPTCGARSRFLPHGLLSDSLSMVYRPEVRTPTQGTLVLYMNDVIKWSKDHFLPAKIVGRRR
jgi:hypothetical protein